MDPAVLRHVRIGIRYPFGYREKGGGQSMGSGSAPPMGIPWLSIRE